jgi:hypothetical protein
MRKVLISIAAAGSVAAIAAPAAAQPYGNLGPAYGAPAYGYGNGYRNSYGNVRALQVRLDGIQRQLGNLARYRMISRAEYRNRLDDSRDIERSLRRNAQDGHRRFTQREAYNIERKIARLEQKIARDVRDGRRGGYRW